jgi:hypothetical protein
MRVGALLWPLCSIEISSSWRAFVIGIVNVHVFASHVAEVGYSAPPSSLT